MTSIREYQQLMKDTYFDRDSRRGLSDTLLWLTCELGELADACLRNDREIMKDEAADVLAWLCSICNLLHIDLDEASFRKYGKGCPKCGHSPCQCREP